MIVAEPVVVGATIAARYAPGAETVALTVCATGSTSDASAVALPLTSMEKMFGGATAAPSNWIVSTGGVANTVSGVPDVASVAPTPYRGETGVSTGEAGATVASAAGG